MIDYIHQENGLRLDVWENAHRPGLYHWQVRRWNSKTNRWDILIRLTDSLLPFADALGEGQRHYEQAITERGPE